MKKLLKSINKTILAVTNIVIIGLLISLCGNVTYNGSMSRYVNYNKGFIDGVKLEKKLTRMDYEMADPNDAIDFLWR